MNIEETLKQLDEIINKLEDENICTDEALKQFECGVNLIKTAKQNLNEVNAKVTVLKQELDGVVEKDFPTDTDEDV